MLRYHIAKSMKHIFVINPCAGGKNHVSEIESRIKALDIRAEIYVTKGAGDATKFVSECCSMHKDEPLRIYACGGDGTLNEVVSGVMTLAQEHGCDNIEVGCYPCGSGNDYVKFWENGNFHDLKALTEAQSTEVDVMKIRYHSLPHPHNPQEVELQEFVRYAINTMNYGFEAEVCRVMDEVRRKPIIGGRMSYVTGIVKSLSKGRHNPCRISVDGKPWKDGDVMLASLANGRYAGGGFLCAPRSLNDDGLIEATAISPISVIRFASMIGYYKNGTYLDKPELQDVISHCRARKVTIESNRQFCIGIDGELLFGSHFDVDNIQKAIRFVHT